MGVGTVSEFIKRQILWRLIQAAVGADQDFILGCCDNIYFNDDTELFQNGTC